MNGLVRALHVASIVLWIGGVAMVTLVLLPAVRALDGRDAFPLFERLERRFAAQARWTTALAGASGLYLAYALELWWRFTEARYWWMWAMVAVWLLFTLMLFLLERLVMHRWFAARARSDPAATLQLIQRMHYGLLLASLVTVIGATAGAHGFLLF